MKLPFTIARPLAVFDNEATGVSPVKDRIVQISVLKFFPDGEIKLKSIIVDPGIPIPKGASDIHGITDEVIKVLKLKGEAPLLKEVIHEIYEFVNDSDLAAYNADYDIPLLAEELIRCGITEQFPKKGTLVLDPMKIFKKLEERTLKAAVKFYCNETLEDAHDSTPDTIAAAKVLIGQVKFYPHLQGMTIEELAKECEGDVRRVDLAGKLVYDEENRVVLNFGKHYGKRLSDVFKSEPTYYTGFLAKSEDFSQDTKMHLKNFYEIIYPQSK